MQIRRINLMRRTLIAALLALVLSGVYAQFGGFGGGGFGGGRGGGGRGGRRGGGGGGFQGQGGGYNEPPPRDIFPGNSFTFARIQFENSEDRNWGGGRGWATDYPQADVNFPRRLAEMTTLRINKTDQGEIKHVILQLTDPDLFKYPFIFFNSIGAMTLHDDERAALRSYLLRGGFMMGDDCWGDEAWANFLDEMHQVLPADQYPIVEIPLTHQIYHIVFDIKEVPQCPTENYYDYWRQTGVTYDPRVEYPSGDTKPHIFGIFDKSGRLMAMLSHNSHLSDGWEMESASEGYFADFSVKKAYPLGINMVVYAMTH